MEISRICGGFCEGVGGGGGGAGCQACSGAEVLAARHMVGVEGSMSRLVEVEAGFEVVEVREE